MAKSYKRINLKTVLEQYGNKAKQAAIDVISKNADELVSGAKNRASGMNRTGKMQMSIRAIKPKRKNSKYNIVVACDAVNETPVKNPGSRNPGMTGKYPVGGFPYPRVLEFSPKYNRPFFFNDYYNSKSALPGQISDAIKKAVTE